VLQKGRYLLLAWALAFTGYAASSAGTTGSPGLITEAASLVPQDLPGAALPALRSAMWDEKLLLGGVAIRLPGVERHRVTSALAATDVTLALAAASLPEVQASGLTWGRFSFPWLTVAAFLLGFGLFLAFVFFSYSFVKLTTPRRKRRYVA